MAFKINKQNRVKVSWNEMVLLYRDMKIGPEYVPLDHILDLIEEEIGLKKTSIRWARDSGQQPILYFKVLDLRKYFLAKIKYGI